QLLREKMSVLHNMMIADRIVSLGLLAAGLSHHIRNSLVAVKTFLDLAPTKMAEEKMSIEGLRNPDFWKEYYTSVQGQIERINNLLKDLWTASEKPSFEFSDQVQLREVVSSSVEALKEGFAAKKIQVKDQLATLPAGSEVTLSAEPYNGTSRPGVLIQVSDNGPGLPQEALRLVFDP